MNLKTCEWCELNQARNQCDMPLCDPCFELVSRLDPWRFLIRSNTTADQRRKMVDYFESERGTRP